MTSETQVNSQTLPVGYTFEDYEITSVLGQGGFGITYKATDHTLQREVAIKEYLPQQFAFRDGKGRVQARSEGDQSLYDWGLNRFVDEARALAKFRHPNISSVQRFIQHNGTAYLVMEFEEGMDLEHWLAARGAPDEKQLVNGILVPVLQGLARVHDKGLLHRDIKPDNIFIRRDGTPVLIDFGASRPHGPQAASKLTSIISAGYSPFEQYGSGDRQGPWSDLYALAGTMYRAISGHPPTDAIARQQGTPFEPARIVGNGRFSEKLLDALDQALSLDISERPQSAREFLTLLGFDAPPAAADSNATFVRRDPVPVGKRKRPTILLIATGLILLIAASVGTYFLLPREAPDSGIATPDAADSAVASADEPTEQTEGNAADSTTDAADVGEPQAETESIAIVEDPPPDSSSPDETEAAPDEDQILADLQISPSVRTYRGEQLAGALLAYTSIKTRFDDCRESGCAQMTTLLAELRQAMESQTWRREDIRGTITIENPRRLDTEACQFMIDVRELIDAGGTSRQQLRTYCTSNGFDRMLQEAQEVT